MGERFLGDRTADEYRAHMNLIKDITDRWHRGEISVTTKRAQIAEENSRFYDGGQLGTTGSAITSEPRITDEISYVLSEGSGAPIEQVRYALHLRKTANARADNAETDAEARELREEGRRAYAEIMRGSRVA